MMDETLIRIGELARQAKVSIDTIKFYERLKLIRASLRTESGYRYYVPAAVSRLRFIRSAKSLGFSLDEIGQLLDLAADRGGSRQDVDLLLHRKVSTLEDQIARLRMACDALRKVLEVDISQSGAKPHGTAERLWRLIEDSRDRLDVAEDASPSKRLPGRGPLAGRQVRQGSND